MYITTRLSEALPAYQRPFSSAEHDILERDGPHILTILGGPSPWRNYLQTNLNSHRRTLPSNFMRICDGGEFVKAYKRIFNEPPPADAQGFVDRRNGRMILKEFPDKNYGKSKVGLALHEAVHLFSHPPGKSNLIRATIYNFLDQGLLEGLTQMVTEDIQSEQGISPMRDRWQPYKEYATIARKFVASFSPRLVGDAFFFGNLNPLNNLVQIKWTIPAYIRLRGLTNQKKTSEALQLIDQLNRPREFQQVFRGQR